MKNQEIAKIFFNIASLLDSGQRDFRPIAYKRAALALAALEEDVAEIYLDNGLDGLEGIPAIGKNLALKTAVSPLQNNTIRTPSLCRFFLK